MEEKTSELKSEIAQHKPRDEEGHFVHAQPSEALSKTEGSNPISNFLGEHTHYSKNQDDILDVHVGNPLRKIVDLLQDIKRQKAFSFTLKGSLGIAGVVLTLSVFGILGAGNLLCDKGVQSEIGVIKVLNVTEKDPEGLPVLSQIFDWFNPKQARNRVVIVKDNGNVLKLPYSKNVNFQQYANLAYPEQSRRVMATGNYDACGQTLTINDPNSLEIYLKQNR